MMTLGLLDTYLDASGKRSSTTDKLITVNGCLSTPAKWQEFDIEWQTALKEFGFQPHPKSGRYVFHTTDFHSGYCKLSPPRLSNARKQAIYHDLIRIVRKYSLFLFGYAINLKDYEKFESKYPFITKTRFGKPGTFTSILGVSKCIDWAGKKGYSKSISLRFDQGDEFWGEMSHGFREFVKSPLNEYLNTDSLTCGDKAVYSPLQAADIVAWECQKYFKRLAGVKIPSSGITPRQELKMLQHPDAYFSLFQYADLERRVSELFPEANGELIAIEQAYKQKYAERDEKLRLKKERRNALRKNQNKDL